MNIKSIFEAKLLDKKKELEKQERAGKKVTFDEEKEESKLMTEEQVHKKRLEEKLNASQASFLSDAQKEKEKEKQDIEQYGRTWIWEGYFNPNNRDKWLAAT